MKLVNLPNQSVTDKALGKVWIVGAGPGDVELLTLKAYRILTNADVVLYDALVSDDIMALAPQNAEKVAVGKRAGKHSAAQKEINQLLITKAYTKKNVVRLKGGDPSIFGRSGEELQALVNAKVEFEVVPGITAASGTAAYAGIPLTHRDYAQSVTFITGHGQKSSRPTDWKSYANGQTTLVIYMGVINAKTIQRGLLEAGCRASLPVAIVSNATTTSQRRSIGTLGELDRLAASDAIQMPALIIIGEVVKLAATLNWFNPQEASQSRSETVALLGH